MSELRASSVHRNLDTKLKVAGFEVYDLLFVLITASVMNLLFGKTSLAFYLVFVVPTLLAGILFFAKRNKPDQYLLHFFRFYLSPGFYSAAAAHDRFEKVRKRIHG